MQYNRPQELRILVSSGRERLEHLAAFVEELAPGRLTFTRWYGADHGCAVGLAAAEHPWFQAQGFCLQYEDSLKDCRPVFGDKTDWCAVAEFFDIDLAEATRMFDRQGYGGNVRPHSDRVAARIRAHLARREPAVIVA